MRVIRALLLGFLCILFTYVPMYVGVILATKEGTDSDVIDSHVWVIVTSIAVLGLVYWFKETGFRSKPWLSSCALVSITCGIVGTLITGNVDFGVVGNFLAWTFMFYKVRNES